MTAEALSPPEEWQHFGCLTCGRVMTLPASATEAAPWCLHHATSYSWRGPNGPREDSDWTQMVRVEVTARAS